MNLVRYNSNYDDYLPTFNSVFNRLFDNTLDKGSGFSPNVDIIENEKNFEVHVVVPGMKKEEFNIDLAENILTISGERKLKNEKKEGNFYSFETQFGSFKRSFRIPKNVDQEKVEATYEDGILRLELPKSEEYNIKNTIKVK
jgi:HSP20 family protein